MPLGTILQAAAAATRSFPEDVRRRGDARRVFLGLAHHQGWRDTKLLARACDVGRAAVYDTIATVDAGELDAAALCLGDDRLLGGALRSATAEARGGVPWPLRYTR